MCKRALNVLVKADNKDRLEKHGDPECLPTSSLASLLTTEGLQHSPTPPISPKGSSSFLQALAKITLKLKELFSGILGLKKRLRDAGDDSPEDIIEKCKKIFNCSEVEHQPGSSFHFDGYHSELYHLADAKQYIPLYLFTLANITIIQREEDTLPMKKIQDCGHGKIMVLDISNPRFRKEVDLMELQWQDAAPHFVDFMSSL
ncbi:uncharacterized protein EV420DRAFT_1473524 [Desarmillaria tabescens]|uniref:Uncharacterized protein n=1 Tax=Armillaria tabescens TaxID=1929756 RepID=A0AA39NS29_ARMTA|nr:uncharacterized protein EV420DRAFT_1473524 [Desarmillaria tabescens]KAK0470468.1 hypothetical protein EV420DRAFT_1473524 [Desarmillaria tabescens]